MELDVSGVLDHRWLLAHRYALVNPLQVDKSDWQDLPAMPIAPPPLHAQASLLPQLICLDAMPPEERIGLLDRVERWQRRGIAFFCALLKSGADERSVAGHLGRRLMLRRPGGGRFLFRYCDPCVFRHLDWLLNSSQRNALLGPVQVWGWPDGDGRWRRMFKGEATDEALPLTAQQWQSLEQMPLINRCLDELPMQEPGHTRNAILARRIDALLSQAHDVHGLESDEDRLLFAKQAIRFHPQIHRHPALDERLRRLHEEPGLKYCTICDDLDDNALQDMARALARGRDRGTP
ncbi:MAG: DUF4123 domain-containing protein [Xanthomonadaceae bacterium]|nr:DUF4123 domain-containing protein [Xanthomonadaceae bacterium]